MSNVHSTFTRLFDNIGFKCKIICHFKISAFAGMTPFAVINVAVYNYLMTISFLLEKHCRARRFHLCIDRIYHIS
jgi:hypothetical protein